MNARRASFFFAHYGLCYQKLCEKAPFPALSEAFQGSRGDLPHDYVNPEVS
jgi:hypothetical protein